MLEAISTLCWIVIASCQIFKVSKNYQKLCDLEKLINRLADEGVLINFKDREAPRKTPGANRNPRTEEQKAKASAKRKEWWARKRAQEGTTPGPNLASKQD